MKNKNISRCRYSSKLQSKNRREATSTPLPHSVKLVLLVKMTNVFYVYFRIITTKEKNTTERPFNVKSTTKKNKTHPSQSIIFYLMLRAKRRSNIYQFDSLGLTRSVLQVSTLTITPSIRLYCEYANYSKCRYDKIVTLDIQFCAPFDNFKELK